MLTDELGASAVNIFGTRVMVVSCILYFAECRVEVWNRAEGLRSRNTSRRPHAIARRLARNGRIDHGGVSR